MATGLTQQNTDPRFAEGHWIPVYLEPNFRFCNLCQEPANPDPLITLAFVHVHPDGGHLAFLAHRSCYQAEVDMRLARLN